MSGNPYEADLLASGPMHPGGARLTARALRLAGLRGGMRVADIGCGAGETARFIAETYPDTDVTGLDISEKLIERARKSNNTSAQFICVDVREGLPLAPARLDAAVVECALSAIGDAPRVLANIALALKPGGRLIVSDIYAKQPSGIADTRQELCEKLASAGFTVLHEEDHTAALVTYVAEMYERGAACCEPFCRFAGTPRPGYVLLICKKEAAHAENDAR